MVLENLVLYLLFLVGFPVSAPTYSQLHYLSIKSWSTYTIKPKHLVYGLSKAGLFKTPEGMHLIVHMENKIIPFIFKWILLGMFKLLLF